MIFDSTQGAIAIVVVAGILAAGIFVAIVSYRASKDSRKKSRGESVGRSVLRAIGIALFCMAALAAILVVIASASGAIPAGV